MNPNDHEGIESVIGDEAPRAGRREWIGLAVIALPCLLYSMDLTVLELAVPKLSADLKPTSSQLLWIMDVYGFLLAGFLITMGTLGDRIGRRRLLLIGASAFGAASVLAAFSNSAEMLIITRAVLGVAGATLAPSTLSLIRNLFLDPAQRAFAIGVWATSFAVGAAIGPLAGGLLLDFFWWGSVLLLALGPVLLPECRDPGAGWTSSAPRCRLRPSWRRSTASSRSPHTALSGYRCFVSWSGLQSGRPSCAGNG